VGLAWRYRSLGMWEGAAMLKTLILTAALALALTIPVHADPQKFNDKATAAKFCGGSNVVWYNPEQQDLLPAWVAVLRQDQERRLHLQGIRREGRLPGHERKLAGYGGDECQTTCVRCSGSSRRRS
jgi:hypothetical protein